MTVNLADLAQQALPAGMLGSSTRVVPAQL
jgi:hypothetical protein